MDSHSEDSKNIWFQVTRLDLSGKCKLFNLDPYGLIVKIDALPHICTVHRLAHLQTN